MLLSSSVQRQFLDIHLLPVALLNVNGYWDKLIDAMHYMASTGLLNENAAWFSFIIATTKSLTSQART